MIKTSPGLAVFGIVFSVLVTAGIIYGLFGEQLGVRDVYHAPTNSAGPVAQ